MRLCVLPYLRCPQTGQRLTLAAFSRADGHVVSGLLSTPRTWYPIIRGVPRLLIGELRTTLLQTDHVFLTQYRSKLPTTIRTEWQQAIDALPDLDAFLCHQKKTAESFAFEWTHIYKENDYERENFFHFLSPFVGPKDLVGKLTVDIGCGSGRFTKWAAKSGTKFSFGTDLGETVEVAYELTKHLTNVCIVQADIYAMPFRRVFDLAYSIGVLHHLPKPQEGFSRLPRVLKRGGRMLIWVYNRRGNARAIYLYEPLRTLLKHLPKQLLLWLCYLPAIAVHLLNSLTISLKTIGLPGLAQRVPFAYYANFPFNMKLNDTFDVLATPKSNYYYGEDVEHWFTATGLADVETYEHPEAGITSIGTSVSTVRPPRRQRIVHLIQSLNSGGCENLLLRTLPRIPGGFEQVVMTLRERGELANEFERRGIRVVNLGEISIFSARFRRKLLNRITKLEPDLILTYLFHADMVGRFLLSGKQPAPVVPYLVTTYNFWRYLPARIFERFTKGMVYHYLTNSEAVKEYYVANIGVPREKITVLPNGIDLALFQSTGGVRVRQGLGLPRDAFVITCVANLAVNKGHRYLLEAFDGLYTTHPNSAVLIVGSGEQRAALEAQVVSYRSKHRIFFLGRRHDVPDILAATDLFVLPTLFEGMSVAIVEAMAAKVAVVTTDIPENRVLITQKKTGILVPPREVEPLRRAIERLLSEPALRRRLAQAAHNYARIHLALEAITELWSVILAQFAGSRSQAPPKHRIVHLISSLESGGAENMLLRTLPLLNDDTYEHVVLTFLRPGGLAPEFVKRGVATHHIGLNHLLDMGGLQRLTVELQSLQPSLVITYLSHADQIGRLYLQRRVVAPVIPFLRTTYNYSRYLPVRMFEWATKGLVRHYLANSEAVRRFYVRHIGVAPGKITVLPNGIDTAVFDHADPVPVRRELRLPRRRFVVICVANFAKSKGHRFLLKAFEAFARTRPEAQLLLVGTGAEEPALRRQIAFYTSRDRVFFLGRRNDIPALLATSDVFVLPTYFEGMSNALLEAMAARLPIITTDIPENRAIIVPGKQGLLVAPGNSVALESGLELLWSDPKRRQELGNQARSFIDRQLQLPLVLKEWRAVLGEWSQPRSAVQVMRTPISLDDILPQATLNVREERIASTGHHA